MSHRFKSRLFRISQANCTARTARTKSFSGTMVFTQHLVLPRRVELDARGRLRCEPFVCQGPTA